jgi:hypothetical protein
VETTQIAIGRGGAPGMPLAESGDDVISRKVPTSCQSRVTSDLASIETVPMSQHARIPHRQHIALVTIPPSHIALLTINAIVCLLWQTDLTLAVDNPPPRQATFGRRPSSPRTLPAHSECPYSSSTWAKPCLVADVNPRPRRKRSDADAQPAPGRRSCLRRTWFRFHHLSHSKQHETPR